MNKLQKQIMEASQKYYSEGTSDVDDATFDNMLEQLREEDPKSPLLTSVGHGYDVNKDTTPGEKVRHKYGTIGSLDKCHNWKEYFSHFKNKGDLHFMHASLKLDGISVVLYYEKGYMYQALTRGSNNIGIDITEFASYILKDNIQLADYTFTGAVRGEIVMSDENFKLFKDLHPEAENARNSTAGLKNSNKITSDLNFLDIIVYTVVGYETKLDSTEMNYRWMIDWLSKNFHNVVKHQLIMVDSSNFEREMEGLRQEWYGEYPADGIVLTESAALVVDNEVQYNAVAFKFKAESAETQVIDVEWNLSKTKYLIPRIQLKTVRLSGTKVSYCAGHNAKYILDSQIGPGATVEVYKSGEIIPYLDKVIEPSDNVQVPQCCPCCGTELTWQGVHLCCPNRECGDFNVQDLLVWMDNIAPHDGLGDTLRLTFMNKLFGDDMSVDAIYNRGDLEFPQAQQVKENEFYAMYHELFNNKVKLSSAIRALNIPRLGEVTSLKLAHHPEEVKSMIEAATSSIEYVPTVEFTNAVGQANMQSILSNLYKFKRLNYIYNNIIWEGNSTVSGRVAITGKLSVKRADFEKELQNHGYLLAGITKSTDFLITDDPQSNSEKNKKADKYNITKITEQEFRNKYM